MYVCGTTVAVEESVANSSFGGTMLTFLQDVRFAFRQFGNHAGFALTAILSLALGIGATVSVFSIVYAVLMNPWPYAGADRICTLSSCWTKPEMKITGAACTGPQIQQLRQAHALEDVMAINGMEPDCHRRRCSGRCPGRLPDRQRSSIPWYAGDAGP